MNKRVYSGLTAIKDYLRPDAEEYSPLVELPPELNPYYEKYGIHVYVKLLNTLPLANVKSLPAWNLLNDAKENLEGKTVVESSSGNTVFSLGILSNVFDIRKVKAIASRDVTQGKLNLLRIAGIDVQLIDGPLCPSPDDPKSSIAIARKLGKAPGWYNPGQYDNDANPEAHRIYTGPQIHSQLGGRVDMFVAGLGTTGTLVGTSDYLRSVDRDTKIIGVVRAPNNAVPGVRTTNGLDEVAFHWKENITDALVTVNEQDSYKNALKLIRHGLLVGPSAGFAYTGVLRQLERMERDGLVDEVAGGNVVFIAPDSMFPYVDEYLAILDAKHFGKIDDQATGSFLSEATNELGGIGELSVEDVYEDYDRRGNDLISQHYTLVDVRDEQEYQDHHLPGSVCIPFESLEARIDEIQSKRSVVFVCRRGTVSLRAALLAKQNNLEAYSMLGGTTEWSAKGLPRILPNTC